MDGWGALRAAVHERLRADRAGPPDGTEARMGLYCHYYRARPGESRSGITSGSGYRRSKRSPRIRSELAVNPVMRPASSRVNRTLPNMPDWKRSGSVGCSTTSPARK
jgi:hypothetical protein